MKRTFVRTCLVVVMIGFFVGSGIDAMGYSHEKGNRMVRNINTGWKYYKGDVNGAEAVSYDDSGWENANIPHNMENISWDASSIYRGMGWYRKNIDIDKSYAGRRVFIDFEAAMQHAKVWINGDYAGANLH